MRFDPVEVGVDGLGDQRDGRILLLRSQTEDPVVRRDEVRNRNISRLATDHWHDALVERSRVLQLLRAHPRLQGIGADDEQERVGPFDGLTDLLPPLDARWKTFPIDPQIAALLAELVVQPTHERLVLARIRHEHVAHGELPRSE